MDEDYLARLVNHLRQRGVIFEQGLSPAEVSLVERTYGFRFPPDLRAFLAFALPVSESVPDWVHRYDAAGRVVRVAQPSRRFPDWRHGPESDLRHKLDGPMEGILFDIEHNVFWDTAWGPIPAELEVAFAIARRELARVPMLIPVYSHRYLPSEPVLVGNPVLSVVQTDITYYGYDLASYFGHEFGMEVPDWAARASRPIRFWSELTS